MRTRHYRLRQRAVERACPNGGRLLDVGCGTGSFLHQLGAGRILQGFGVDFNQRALAVARSQELMVWRGLSDALSVPTACCDVVTLWEVLEHVANLQATLIEIHRVLRPNGWLLISTPNCESLQARLWHAHWGSWDIPRHLQIFTIASLSQLLKETGFISTRRIVFPLERYVAVESALQLLNRKNGRYMGVAIQRLLWLAGVVAWPALRLLDYTTASSGQVIVARAVPQN